MSRRSKTKRVVRQMKYPPCCFYCDLWARVLDWRARKDKQAGYEERVR